MMKISNQNLGIQHGSIILFSDYEHGGKMWSGSGPRTMRDVVRFEQKYTSNPVVQVSISMWDFDHGSNQRADISAQNVSQHGFDLVFKTWGDTRIARIRADWTAFGEVKGEDDWELY